MDGPTDPLMFLGWVVLISASGVIAPGPLFATAVARGIDDPRAGLKISLGHAIVEMPLILTIFLGLVSYSVSKGRSLLQGRWLRVIYVACGIFLILFAMYFLYGSLDTFLTLR